MRKNLPITVTHEEVKRYFMSIEQSSKLVLEANTLKNNSIYHLDIWVSFKIFIKSQKI